MSAPVELRTDRLLLRAFREDDVADALAYRNDPEFARFLPHIPQPFTRTDAETLVRVNMTEPPESSITFAVVLGGTLIGTTNIDRGEDKHIAMLGYAIGRKWWSQGVATEAARAVTAWAIAELQLTRLWASTDSRHIASQRVLEKLGMQHEATRVAHGVGREGEPIDEVVYAFIDCRVIPAYFVQTKYQHSSTSRQAASPRANAANGSGKRAGDLSAGAPLRHARSSRCNGYAPALKSPATAPATNPVRRPEAAQARRRNQLTR